MKHTTSILKLSFYKNIFFSWDLLKLSVIQEGLKMSFFFKSNRNESTNSDRT